MYVGKTDTVVFVLLFSVIAVDWVVYTSRFGERICVRRVGSVR
jgi:hypothetical protein